MDFHFATAWETIADIRGDHPALICDNVVRSWREYEDRAARVASVLTNQGLEPGFKAGLYLHNSNQYQEAQFGIFKARGCPVNVNYRYKADELVYLLDNADCEVLFFQSTYAARIWEIRNRLPKVKAYIQVHDGTEMLIEGAIDFDSALMTANPMPRIDRDPTDTYMLYTGGTTGMPKGVMYPVGEFSYGLMAVGAAGRGMEPPASMAALADYVQQIEPPVSLPACPLMHGTGMWLGGFVPMMAGGTVVTTSKLGLDPDLLWGLVEQHGVTDLVIVGDAFAKPLLAALDAAAERGSAYDIASLKQITSSGVMWSRATKEGLLKHHDMVLNDIMGSTEGGMGSSQTTRDGGSETAKFQLNEGVKVFTDDGREVAAGAGEMGRVATSGMVPIGYYKDPEKSAETFAEIGGVRYSFPGDYATVEADGSITLLGRGSVCINTAGEKVFPEEVEEAVKQHPEVTDCLVVGVPDDRFGERVVAVTSFVGDAVDEAALIEFVRERIAGYKLPRHVLAVAAVRRAPNGKPNYKWAKTEALREYSA